MKQLFWCTLVCLFQTTLFATTFNVTNGSDTGPNTLREAIGFANTDPATPHVNNNNVFGITLSSLQAGSSFHLPDIIETTINGNGVLITTSATDTRFAQLKDAVTINEVNFSNFSLGCLFVIPSDGAIATLFDCGFQNCTAISGLGFSGGGAIQHYDGMLNIIDCVFINCEAINGGAIFVISDAPDGLLLDGCTFSNNTAVQRGNAIYIAGDNLLSLSGQTNFSAAPTQDIHREIPDLGSQASIQIDPGFSMVPGSILSIN